MMFEEIVQVFIVGLLIFLPVCLILKTAVEQKHKI